MSRCCQNRSANSQCRLGRDPTKSVESSAMLGFRSNLSERSSEKRFQTTFRGFVILKPHNFLCGLSLSVFEVFAEIDGADLFVVDQVVGLAGGEDGAVADDVGSVADAEGFAYVVVGNEYADAA